MEAEGLPSSIGGTCVTLLMKQKILESNCWWIITRRENSQLHWLGEQGVLFWTSGVNELWPEIYNLVVSVMALTSEHNQGNWHTPQASGQTRGSLVSVLPFFYSAFRVAQETCWFLWPPWLEVLVRVRSWKRFIYTTDLCIPVTLEEFRRSVQLLPVQIRQGKNILSNLWFRTDHFFPCIDTSI